MFDYIKRQSGNSLGFITFISKMPIRTLIDIYLAPFVGANKGWVSLEEGEITLQLRLSGQSSSRHSAYGLGLWCKIRCTLVDKRAFWSGHSSTVMLKVAVGSDT